MGQVNGYLKKTIAYELRTKSAWVLRIDPLLLTHSQRIKKKHGETMRNRSCMFMSFHVPATIPYDSRPKDGRSLEVVRSAALADLWPGSSPSSFYSFAFRFKTWPIKINGLHSNAFKCHKWIQQEESSVIGIELMALSWSVTAHSRKVSVDWTRPHEMSAGHGESYKVSNTGQVPSYTSVDKNTARNGEMLTWHWFSEDFSAHLCHKSQ